MTFVREIVASAIKKIKSIPIYHLSAAEFRAYFEYRIEKILLHRVIIVRNELEYLLCETGRWNLRIDPEFIPLITREKTLVSEHSPYPNTQELLQRKIGAENYIFEASNSPETQRLILDIISPYLNQPNIVSIEPFVVDGQFEGIPVSCLIRNGRWILPDKEFFSFLRRCQTQNKFPVLISKKISGILFPFFRSISVMGLNTYKIILPRNGQRLIEEIREIEGGFYSMKYCNQFHFIDKDATSKVKGEDPTPDLIRPFFETTLRTHIAGYFSAFLHSRIIIKDNFIDTASQFKMTKSTDKLLKTYMTRQHLKQELMLLE